MIAYNDRSLDNLVVNTEAADAVHRYLISKDEYEAIKKAHANELYKPNIFIRIGLFLATASIVSMSFGLLLMIFGGAADSETGMFIITLIFAVAVYAALEWIIRRKKHYRSGVDDALLWNFLGFMVADVFIVIDLTYLQQSVFIFILSLVATLRFANSVLSAVTFISLMAIVFTAAESIGSTAKTILPFVVMIMSVIIYWIIKTNKNKHALRHYRFCMMMIEFLSLVTAYAAVNYFVVRELTIIMFGINLPDGASIPGGWFFWTATLVIPPLYIIRALQTKDSLLLRTGLLVLAATVFTVRVYYAAVPIEQVMTAGGLILIVAAYFLIKYLQTPRYGISDKQTDDENIEDSLQLEAVVVTETFQKVPAPGTGEGFQFGGGSSGGGGASGEY